MHLRVHAKTVELSAAEAALLAECDAGAGLTKFPMRPPSMLRIVVMTPNLVLGCVALFLAAYLVVVDKPWLGGVLATVGVGIEIIFGLPGFVALYRRRRLDHYYVCFHPQGLIERRGADVTMIPIGRLVRAVDARGKSSVLYRDATEVERALVLQTWYATKNNQPNDLVEPINEFYRLHEHRAK